MQQLYYYKIKCNSAEYDIVSLSIVIIIAKNKFVLNKVIAIKHYTNLCVVHINIAPVGN